METTTTTTKTAAREACVICGKNPAAGSKCTVCNGGGVCSVECGLRHAERRLCRAALAKAVR